MTCSSIWIRISRPMEGVRGWESCVYSLSFACIERVFGLFVAVITSVAKRRHLNFHRHQNQHQNHFFYYNAHVTPPPFPRPIYVTRVDSQVLSATSNALGTYLSYRAGENTAPLSLRKQGRCRPYCSCCLDSALGQGGGGEGEEGEGERGGREGRREYSHRLTDS